MEPVEIAVNSEAESVTTRIAQRIPNQGFFGPQLPTVEVVEGKLTSPISVGSSINLDNGWHSDEVASTIEDPNGRILIKTPASEYEVLDNTFRGLDFDSPLGSVHFPADAQIAKLGSGIVSIDNGPEAEHSNVLVNKDALQGVLLESYGTQLFHIDGRYFVLAKVGNIHLPFYRSFRGTSGKQQGAWHPFFGLSANKWFVKGNRLDENGIMTYSPEVDEVTRTLNDNLKIPSTINQLGIVPPDDRMGIPSFKLSDHLSYVGNYSVDPQEGQVYVAKVTGYKPGPNINMEHPSDALGWIDSIVARAK